MILRLQSVEELELLQSRIKSKSKAIRVHVNEVQASRGTESGILLKAKLLKTPSRTHQERLKASNKLKVASDKDYWAKTLQKQYAEWDRGPLMRAIPILQTEYRFHPERKWRFDLALMPTGKPPGIAIEIEGAIWTQGRHTRGKGFLQDMEKYNEATRLGWRVYRFTPNQVKTRYALEYLKVIL